MRLLLAAIAACLLIAAPAAAVTERASLPDIEDEVMCPTCGVVLSESFSPQAERQRSFIRRQVALGKTKAQIKQELVDQFGERVLATPRKEGFELTAYVVPIIAVLIAAIGVGIALLRWRRAPAESAEPPAEIASSDASRLERDLSNYDL